MKDEGHSCDEPEAHEWYYIAYYFVLTSKICITISIQRGQIMTPCRWPRWYKYLDYTSNRPLFKVCLYQRNMKGWVPETKGGYIIPFLSLRFIIRMTLILHILTGMLGWGNILLHSPSSLWGYYIACLKCWDKLYKAILFAKIQE